MKNLDNSVTLMCTTSELFDLEVKKDCNIIVAIPAHFTLIYDIRSKSICLGFGLIIVNLYIPIKGENWGSRIGQWASAGFATVRTWVRIQVMAVPHCEYERTTILTGKDKLQYEVKHW